MNRRAKISVIIGTIVWLCLACSCTESKVSERLHYIEAELDRSSYVHNSLRNELDSIMTFAHLSDREMALGQVLQLRSQMMNHDNLDGSLADQALEYYERHHDPRMLAWCHLARGVYLAYQLEKFDESIQELKKAEELSMPINDHVLKYYIVNILGQTNHRIQNYEHALKYALRVMEYCKALNDTSKMISGLNNLATAYALASLANGDKSLMDSATLNIRRCIPLMHCMDNNLPGTPFIYGTISGSYLDENKMDSALFFAQKSMQVRPTYYGYLLLASIAEKQGDIVRADSLYQRSLLIKDKYASVATSEGKVQPLRFYYNFKLRQGQYQDACELANLIVTTKDSVNRARQVQVVNELQTKYDQEVKRRALDKKLYRYGVITAVLLVLIMAMIALWRYRSLKAKAERLRLQGQLSEYRRQVLELETNGEGNSRTIELLNAKIEELQQGLHDTLFHGRQKYEEIMAGGNTVKWDKQDFEDFINYYRLIDLPYITEMEAKYENLSPRNLFYLVLERMEKSNEEIQNILCIGASSLRTLRSRLRKQLKTTTPQEREN